MDKQELEIQERKIRIFKIGAVIVITLIIASVLAVLWKLNAIENVLKLLEK